MTVDIIILSHSKTQPLLELTQRTIDSVHRSESNIQFNVIVIEQEAGVVHSNCITHHISEPFNYNRFMNIGIAMTANEYVCLCNNDLVFEKDWCINIIGAMESNNILSACPAQYLGKRGIEYGYNNSRHMMGWCIMTNRKLYDKIGKINEGYPFWFADNVYAEQLKAHNIPHAVVNSSVVSHLGSSTLKTLSKQDNDTLTVNEIKRFCKDYPDNESARYFKSR